METHYRIMSEYRAIIINQHCEIHFILIAENREKATKMLADIFRTHYPSSQGFECKSLTEEYSSVIVDC
jgi:hypothetical protein